MPKATESKPIEWFGADVETHKDGKQTVAVLDGYKGVDADVPKTKAQPDGSLKRLQVRMPAPRLVQTRTTGKDADIAALTARYKLMRSAFQFSPVADKETWERRMDIAFREMQVARFGEELKREEARTPRNEAQITHWKNKIALQRGYLAELLGQVH